MKNNNKLYTVLGIIIVVLALLGASYLGRSIMNSEDKSKVVLIDENNPNDFTVDGNTCYNRPKYFVVTRPDSSGNGGEDILIKNKTSEGEEINCEYTVEENDFELLDNLSAPQHFSSLSDDYLIIDKETETSKSFEIYDLVRQEKTYGDTYTPGLFDLKGNILTYWHKTNDIPNRLNCSKIDEYNKIGGAKIEAKMSINITNPKREISDFRCSALK